MPLPAREVPAFLHLLGVEPTESNGLCRVAERTLYVAARDQGRAFVKASMEAILTQDRLDAIVYPTSTMPIGKIGDVPKRNSRELFGNFDLGLVSLAGWPELTVPAAFTSDGLPIGISFIGPAYSEMRLLAYEYAFEQATHALRQPVTTPSLSGDCFTY